MADALVRELGVEDLYGFLGVTSTANDKELKKAYRKKALRYHPDKNPDNPSAADMFQKLSRIYGVLTDPAAKAAYDKWLKIKEMVKRRNEELSAKRRKLKDSLESKENEHYATLQAEHEARQMMKTQIERLREQNAEMVRKQQELLRSSFQDNDSDLDEKEDVIIQATWEKGSEDFSVSELTDTFSKYGRIEDVVKKKSKALISFAKACDAISAIKELSDKFKFKWISGKPPILTPLTSRDVVQGAPHGSSGSCSGGAVMDNTDDYEQQVLERLRKAQEKKVVANQL